MVTQENQTTEERAFLVGIAAEPWCYGPRLVYADWLDERERDVEGSTQRLIADKMKKTEYGWVRPLGFADNTLIVLRDGSCVSELKIVAGGVNKDLRAWFEETGCWLRKEIVP